MFIVLAVPVGLVLGFLMGGRLDRLSEIRFEWAWLAVVGLAVQVLLFSTPIGGSFRGGVGVANDGVMPTTPGALAAAGLDPLDGFSNSAVLEDPALAPLTDIFALPHWLPFANVFSIGDVLIALGIVVVIAVGMTRGEPASHPA